MYIGQFTTSNLGTEVGEKSENSEHGIVSVNKNPPSDSRRKWNLEKKKLLQVNKKSTVRSLKRK